MSRLMHLLFFMDHCPMNHSVGSWRHPEDRQGREFSTPAFWQEVARTAERGCLDGVFLADQLGPFQDFRSSTDDTLRYGVSFPMSDPLPLVAMMGAVTERLGLAVTMSTAAYNPYIAARNLASLARLFEGRIGWNVVTSYGQAEYANLGFSERMAHAERYPRAQEFLEICQALWGSWEPGALLDDRSSGQFLDPSRIKPIDYEGSYFSCAGPLNALPPEPGQEPVIFQAGSSSEGRAFAVRNAEVVFSVQLDARGMRKFVGEIAEVAEAEGKQAPKVVFGVQTFVGKSAAHGEELREEFNALVPDDGALAKVSGTFGQDFSTMDLDQPLQDMQTEANQGLRDAFMRMFGGELSLREVAQRFGRSSGMPQVAGDGASVADQLQSMFEDGGGDGFNVTPGVSSVSLGAFVDRVVPELQDRGLARKRYTTSTLREHLAEDHVA